MNVWVLYKKEFIETGFAAQRFLEEGEKAGVNVTIVSPDDFDIVVNDEGSQSIHKNGRAIKRLPDCIIPRMGAGTTYFALAILRHLERLGVYCLNNSEAIELAKDKLASLQELSLRSLPIPKTMLAKRAVDTKFIQKEFRFPVVLKKLTGSQGKGIVLCKSRSQLADTVELVGTEHNMIIQEYIRASKGKDIRVLVLGGRPIGAMLRKAGRGTFKANVSKGGTAENLELTPELEWIAAESANALGLECAGVDLLFDNKGYVVCEVNSSPGFKGFEPATGVNVPGKIFEFLKVRLGL